jgi:uncharacterized membrane protein
MPKKQTKKISAKKDDSDSKLFAFLGVFLTIVGYIVVMVTRKDDKYAMYYAKQGLVLFIAWVIVAVAGWIIGWIPVAGHLMGWVLNAFILALWIIGIVFSLSGDEKEIPLIGEFARKI